MYREITCRGCGVQFTWEAPRGKVPLYHDLACRRRTTADRPMEDRSASRSCLTCHKAFPPRAAGGKPQRYCDETCRKQAAHDRMALRRPRKFPTLASRFWPHVDIGEPDDCWPWKPGHARNGQYGAFGIGGRRENGGYMTTAQRVALALYRGVPVESIAEVVRHSCDNPPCQNPRHLDDGTQAQNIADAQQKGRLVGNRHRRGTPQRISKLSPEDVAAIKAAYAAPDHPSQPQLAIRWSVSTGLIWQVLHDYTPH